MEHIPETDIRGNLSNKEKEIFIKERENYPCGLEEETNKVSEFFKEHAREKTGQEIAAIELANEETNKILIKFGLQPFNIPTDNYYILSDDILRRIRGNRTPAAAALLKYNFCIFRDTKEKLKPVVFGCCAFHETLHLKNYISFKHNTNGEIQSYRAGITVSTSQKDQDRTPKVYLRGLAEATMTKMNEEYLDILLQHPEFAKEAEWWESKECNLLKKKLIKDYKISKSEISWIEPSDKEIFILGYKLERRLLDYICSEIQKKNPDRYPSEKDVLTEFQRAQVTGKLLNIARDITQTFGEGSFRKIAGYPEDWRLRLHFETLKLKRKINKS